MSEPHERLKDARERAGYDTASAAAEAIGVRTPTYVHHENGTRGLGRSANRYAKFFRVSLDWLLDGRGPAIPTRKRSQIEMVGTVGAGAVVYGLEEETSGHSLDYIDWPDASDVRAVRVDGDSQYPRYLNGELILVSKEAVPADRLVGRYAMVICDDGRQLVKIIRRMPGADGLFRLESHNAPPEDDVEIVTAYPVMGTLDA